MANDIIKVEETDKALVITGQIENWEEFFLDEKNFMPIIDFTKTRARGLVADATTKEGQKERKTLVKKINALVKDIDNAHDEVVKAYKEKSGKIDKVRKKVKDTLLMYKEELLAPIKEIEQRQAEIVEIDNMPATRGIGCDSAALKFLLEELDELEKKDWKESKADAMYSIGEARRQINDMLARQEKAEEDARKLAEYQRREAEIATAEKEKAEAEKKKAQEEAEKAKAEAEKAKKEAEEARQMAEQAEADKVAAEKAKELAESKIPEWKKNEIPESERLFPEDVNERKRRFNREAMEAIAEIIGKTPVAIAGTEGVAKAIVTAIVNGHVPHIYMDYELEK